MVDKDARLAAVEAALAHVQRQADELSDEVARQAQEMAALQRRVGMLVLREAEREADAAGIGPPADQKPPHW